ncbi:hypothetical protein D9M69_581000 [compost metagenome]
MPVYLLPLDEPEARTIHLPLMFFGYRAGAMRTDEVGAAARQIHQIGTANDLLQLLEGRQREAADAGLRFAVLAALRALPVPPSPVAGVVQADDAGARRRLVGRLLAPGRVGDLASGRRLRAAHAARLEGLGALQRQGP